MECRKCDFCHLGPERDLLCGNLLTDGDFTAHHKCMQYSAGLVQYNDAYPKLRGFKLKEVKKEKRRSKHLKCSECKGRRLTGEQINSFGASGGCAVRKCKKSFHFPCARCEENIKTSRFTICKKGSKSTLVLYRIFCSQEHKSIYLKEQIEDENYILIKDLESGESDSDYCDESDDFDSDMTPMTETSSMTPTPPHDESFSDKPKQKKYMLIKDRESGESDNTDDYYDSDMRPTPPHDESVSDAPKQRRRSRPDGNETTPAKAKRVRQSRTPSSSTDEEKVDSSTSSVKKVGNAQHLEEYPLFKKGVSISKPIKKPSLPISSSLFKAPSPTNFSKENDGSNQVVKKKPKKTPTATKPLRHLKHMLDSEDECEPPNQRRCTNSPGVSTRNQHNTGDMVLCFCHVEPGLPKGSEAGGLLAEGARKYPHLGRGRVCLWSGRGALVEGAIIYLLLDISQALRKGELDKFQDLVLGINDAQRENYKLKVQLNSDLDHDLLQNIYSQMWKTIKNNFTIAEADVKGLVGQVSEQLQAAYILVSSRVDPDTRIRRKLQSILPKSLFSWSDTTTYGLCVPEMLGKGNMRIAEVEEEKLLLWLHSFIKDTTFRVEQYPAEPIFHNPDGISVVAKLWNQFENHTQPKTHLNSSVLAFIGPVDESVVNFRVYLQRVLPALMEQHLSRQCPVLAVFDIWSRDKNTPHVLGHEDLAMLFPDHVSVNVWTAFDPSLYPVTAAILHCSHTD